MTTDSLPCKTGVETEWVSKNHRVEDRSNKTKTCSQSNRIPTFPVISRHLKARLLRVFKFLFPILFSLLRHPYFSSRRSFMRPCPLSRGAPLARGVSGHEVSFPYQMRMRRIGIDPRERNANMDAGCTVVESRAKADREYIGQPMMELC